MTAEEFAEGYAVRSGVTVELLRKHGLEARLCDCGADCCEGWKMVPVHEDQWYRDLYATLRKDADRPTVDELLLQVESGSLTAAEFLKLTRAKPPKYRNKVTVIDGQRYDSQGEAARHQELKLLEKAGTVRNIKRQVKFKLEVSGFIVGTFTADFTYEEITDFEYKDWVSVVEDFKSGPTKTEAYRLRKRLMLACHGIEIRETGA